MSDSNANEPQAVSVYQEAASAVSAIWWVMLLRGVLLIILGCYALFRPGMTTVLFTQVIAVFVIADGILAIIAGIVGDVPSRAWFIVRGIISILVGAFVFAHPVTIGVVAVSVILYVIAFGAIITGIFEIVSAIVDGKKIEGAGWLFVGGVLAILFGVLLLGAPMFFGALFVRILGAFTIIFGISVIAMSLQVRRFGKALGKAG